MTTSINIHRVKDIDINTLQHEWGQTICVEVTSTDGNTSEILLYQNTNVDKIQLTAKKGQVT